MLRGLGGHKHLREEAAGPVLPPPGPRLLGDSSKTDLLGCFGAEAIGVESQWVLKVRVHPPHDVGAELPGRGSARLCFQGGPRTAAPLAAATRWGCWERSSPPTSTPVLHPPTSPPPPSGPVWDPAGPRKSLRKRATAQCAGDAGLGALRQPTLGPALWESHTPPCSTDEETEAQERSS